MSKENIIRLTRSALSDLRKCDSVFTEGFLDDPYSDHVSNQIDKLNVFMKDLGINDIDEIVDRLEELQEECEKDNSKAKKTVTISRPDLIEKLIKSNIDLSKKITSFVSKSYSSGDKLLDSVKSIEKDIKKIDKLCDEVFSFKDDFNKHTVITQYFSLVKLLKDTSPYFDMYSDCLSEVKHDEEIINDFNELRRDIKISGSKELLDVRDHCGFIHNKLKAFKDISNSYYALTTRIYSKTYQMINGLK